MRVVELAVGEFWMGDRDWELWRSDARWRRVRLTRRYAAGVMPVTQGEYAAVMYDRPSFKQGDLLPVDSVSWEMAVDFCSRLSEREGRRGCYRTDAQGEVACDFDADGWRLPTEAEWEYAARGGQGFRYAGSDSVDEVAWYRSIKKPVTRPPGQKRPNGFGLYDMCGNVDEWCWDRYGPYAPGDVTDPAGSATGGTRVIRGGSAATEPLQMRVYTRNSIEPEYTGRYLGFRGVRTLPS